MGAKTWMLAIVENDAKESLKQNPELNRDASIALANKLFPSEKLEIISDGDLSYTCPPNNEIYIGVFPGISIVAAKEFGIDYPSKLPQHFIDLAGPCSIYLHAMHSVVDWFAYAVWTEGKLVRSLSVSPDNGIQEDIGERLSFEMPYWEGKYPAIDPDEDDADYPLQFHPLEFGEAALLEFFGYQLEGPIDASQVEPESIPLVGLKRVKSKWKFW